MKSSPEKNSKKLSERSAVSFSYFEVARDFRRNLPVSDRMNGLKRYKKVFLGNDAVTFLVERGHAGSREEALQLGQTMKKKGVFKHVKEEQDLQDDKLFYRFCDATGDDSRLGKTRSEQISPLMATSQLIDAQREEKQKERDERKAERNKTFAKNTGATKKKAPDKKKKEEQDANNLQKRKKRDEIDARLGCCFRFGEFLVKAVHVVDGIIGICFLAYGIFLVTAHENPNMEAMITSLAFGSFLLFTSILGVTSFALAACRRCGLVLSMASGVILALFYGFILMYALVNEDPVFDYLTEHKDGMSINDKEIAMFRRLLPISFIVLAALVGTNILRFTLLLGLREKLLRYDATKKRIAPEGGNITTPLLDQELGITSKQNSNSRTPT